MSNDKQTDYSKFSMFELFCVEVDGQCALLIDNLLNLEREPDNAVHLEVLMRAAHSLKGAARLVEIKPVENIAHVLEDCFVAAQAKKINLDENHIDILLKSIDLIKNFTMHGETEWVHWENNHKSIIDSTINLISGILKPAQLSSLIPSKSKKTSALKDQAIPNEIPVTPNKNVPQERVLRVSSDRLNRIMGLSGELLIISKWVYSYSTSMLQIKKRQLELTQTLETLKDSLKTITDNDPHINSQISSVLSKASVCRTMLADRLSDLESFEHHMSNLSARLYREVLSSTMRPFADGVQGFHRMVRDIARQTQKKVKLTIIGLDNEVDRDVLEKIEAPLTHLIRNAIDHGIEFPEDRKANGKPETGKITISAVYSGGQLSIIVEDDGQGIDFEALKKTIVKRGLVTQEIADTLSEHERLEFLFLPNFTTRETVTELSGRGVGLDVVHKAVQEIRGLVHIHSSYGNGTRFTLQLPLTLSVVPALLVEISKESYAFPLIKINRVIKVNSKDLLRMEGHQYVTYGDEYLGLISGSQIFGKQPNISDKDEISIVIVNDHLNKYGVVVDELVGQRELVVQSLDPRLGKVKDISASAILEDGRPTLIIDVDDFVRSINNITTNENIAKVTYVIDVADKKTRKKILVVDDSITVRGIERNLLEANRYEVVLAVDGIDGWNTLRSQTFDLVITDVDMPRMDGIELVHMIRNDPNLNTLPVMIVSYKDLQEDRQRGLDAGADYYLTKGSFLDETLLESVIDLIGEA